MDFRKLELPGLELVDPNADYSGTQTIFIDFNGANGVSYDNDALNIYINNIDVKDSGLSEEDQFEIITDLNNSFAGTGVSFTGTFPVNEEYSTIYVGGSGSAFSEYGNFLGLSETIDAGNQDKSDEAFVFSDKLSSTISITETIAHEAGHLLGFAHGGDNVIDGLSDFAAGFTLPDGSMKLTTSDGEANDWFGYSVFVSGDTVIAGAPADNNYSGSAYIYRWNGSTYIGQKLQLRDGAEGDMFGYSVSACNYDVVVGSPDDDNLGGVDAGGMSVYHWNGSYYIEYRLNAVGLGDFTGGHLGTSVGISERNVVAGAPHSNPKGDGSGGVWVYRWDGSHYALPKQITASDGAAWDAFGRSVSISGDYVLVGAGEDDSKGSAYVYRWNGSSYEEVKKLIASDGEAEDYFGYSVSISGDNLVVGAYGNDDDGGDSGSAYVYRRSGSYYAEYKLTASDGAADDRFGSSVSISGDYVLVGAGEAGIVGSGSAYLYHWNGSSYDEIKKLTSYDGAAGDRFGSSVSIFADNIVTGAYWDDDNGFDSGSVYTYSVTELSSATVPNDFDGNGKSDILWHNQSSGTVGLWLEGNGRAWRGLGSVSPVGWEIAGTGDFNGNGTSDILWQHKSTGLVGMWESGTDWQAVRSASRSSWEIVGTGDFNDNGTSDILWQHKITGLVGVWESGTDWQGIRSASRSSWEIVGTGDFNDNGTSDILWQHRSTGLVGMWESGADWQAVRSASRSSWEIVGAGDFNGNGTSDILWQHKITGLVGMWESGTDWQAVRSASRSSWEIVGTGDFNGNGTSDILWQNKGDHSVGMWESGTDWQSLGKVGSDWKICIA